MKSPTGFFQGAVLGLVKSVSVRALLFMGFSWVTMDGLTTAANLLIGYMDAVPGQLPPAAVALMKIGGFDIAINLVISAYLALLAVRGLATGAKWLTKAGV